LYGKVDKIYHFKYLKVTLSFLILWRIKNFILVYNFLISPINLNKLENEKEYSRSQSYDKTHIMENPMNNLTNKFHKANTTVDPKNINIKENFEIQGRIFNDYYR